ncbi:MAG TPA: YciI family protein [Thermomicrobiales bacterium]|nr:YciI family protein [Thermomicrobiales bacterium]
MKYMLMIFDPSDYWETTPEADQEREFQEHAAFGRWLDEHGIVHSGEALQSPAVATALRRNGDEVVVSDGPFIELKETIGGFYLFEAPDLDVALDVARRCPANNVELRPVWG